MRRAGNIIMTIGVATFLYFGASDQSNVAAGYVAVVGTFFFVPRVQTGGSMSKIKIMVSILAMVLLSGSGVQAQEEAVLPPPEIPEVSEEVPENPYGEPFQIKTTAYCSCSKCCGHSHGITKSGRPAAVGLTVASNLYYGKTVILYDEDMNYIGIYECTDTGTDGLDIYMDNHEAALEFGVHYYFIQVVDAAG